MKRSVYIRLDPAYTLLNSKKSTEMPLCIHYRDVMQKIEIIFLTEKPPGYRKFLKTLITRYLAIKPSLIIFVTIYSSFNLKKRYSRFFKLFFEETHSHQRHFPFTRRLLAFYQKVNLTFNVLNYLRRMSA